MKQKGRLSHFSSYHTLYVLIPQLWLILVCVISAMLQFFIAKFLLFLHAHFYTISMLAKRFTSSTYVTQINPTQPLVTFFSKQKSRRQLMRPLSKLEQIIPLSWELWKPVADKGNLFVCLFIFSMDIHIFFRSKHAFSDNLLHWIFAVNIA